MKTKKLSLILGLVLIGGVVTQPTQAYEQVYVDDNRNCILQPGYHLPKGIHQAQLACDDFYFSSEGSLIPIESEPHNNNPVRFGFANRQGKVVIDLQYDDATVFQEGLAGVKKDGKWGFIDQNNNKVIDFQYDHIEVFRQGLALVKKDNKWGFIDKNNQIIIPFIYDKAWVFNELGLASVAKKSTNSNKLRWGVIDKKNNIALPIQYDFIDDLAVEGSEGYKDGFVRIGYDQDDETLMGLAKLSADKLIEAIAPEHKYLTYVYEGRVSIGCDNGLNRLIDLNNNPITDCQYELFSDFSEGLIATQKNDKWGYLDKDGNVVIDFIYDDAGFFQEGVAMVMIGDETFYIDKKGKRINPKE